MSLTFGVQGGAFPSGRAAMATFAGPRRAPANPRSVTVGKAAAGKRKVSFKLRVNHASYAAVQCGAPDAVALAAPVATVVGGNADTRESPVVLYAAPGDVVLVRFGERVPDSAAPGIDAAWNTTGAALTNSMTEVCVDGVRASNADATVVCDTVAAPDLARLVLVSGTEGPAVDVVAPVGSEIRLRVPAPDVEG